LETTVNIHENLPQLAAEAFAIATRGCGACRNMHGLWPYLRIARIGSGVEGGRAAVSAAIGKMCANGPKDVLIAGAVDTGVLCLAAQARGGRAARFTVIDLCETPLALCRAFARQWNLQVATLIHDAQHLDFKNRFDLIIVHSLLQFIPVPERINVFSRFAAALRPHGKIVQVFNTGRRIEGTIVAEHRREYPERVLAELDARNVPLPAPREAFHAMLAAYALEREQREGAAETPDEVHAMMRTAGLSIESCLDLDLNVEKQYGEFLAKLSKRRYLSVATVT
jgi:hypothetical protein